MWEGLERASCVWALQRNQPVTSSGSTSSSNSAVMDELSSSTALRPWRLRCRRLEELQWRLTKLNCTFSVAKAFLSREKQTWISQKNVMELIKMKTRRKEKWGNKENTHQSNPYLFFVLLVNQECNKMSKETVNTYSYHPKMSPFLQQHEDFYSSYTKPAAITMFY